MYKERTALGSPSLYNCDESNLRRRHLPRFQVGHVSPALSPSEAALADVGALCSATPPVHFRSPNTSTIAVSIHVRTVALFAHSSCFLRRSGPLSLPVMSLSNSASFIDAASSSESELDSLPSSSTGSSVDDDEFISDAEREWRESLQQIELMLTMIIVPVMGKYFGRKCAYWGEWDSTVGNSGDTDFRPGWAKFMEWKYPVEIVVTDPKLFKATGVVEAAASL